MDYSIEILVLGGLCLFYAFYLLRSVTKLSPGSKQMQEIALAIQQGAMTYLRRQYSSIAIFIIMVFLGVAYFVNLQVALAYVGGGIFSMLAGLIGMSSATRANVRTTNAAAAGNRGQALGIAFRGGAVMGMAVASLGVIGLGIIWWAVPDLKAKALIVSGFSMGASSVALFAETQQILL